MIHPNFGCLNNVEHWLGILEHSYFQINSQLYVLVLFVSLLSFMSGCIYYLLQTEFKTVLGFRSFDYCSWSFFILWLHSNFRFLSPIGSGWMHLHFMHTHTHTNNFSRFWKTKHTHSLLVPLASIEILFQTISMFHLTHYSVNSVNNIHTMLSSHAFFLINCSFNLTSFKITFQVVPWLNNATNHDRT